VTPTDAHARRAHEAGRDGDLGAAQVKALHLPTMPRIFRGGIAALGATSPLAAVAV